MGYKLENLPRNSRGEYGIKARIPGIGAKSFRAPTINEAKKAAMHWIEGVESGVERTSPEITLAEYRAEIASGMKWSPVTRLNRDSLWTQHIEPRFGADPLSTIGRSEIREWLTGLKRQGVGPAAVEAAVVSLMILLNEAARDGRIAAAPNTRGLRPEVEARRGIALTPVQAQRLLEALPDRYRTVAVVQITTGMRINEILALRLEDFDRNKMLISVTKSVPLVAKSGSVKIADRAPKGPKTKSGRREVPLFPGTLAAVDDHVDRFGLSPEGYLFTTMRGQEWLSYHTFLFTWRETVRRLRDDDPEFPVVKTHDLRKTFGSWMMASPTVTPMETAKVLGHKNASITLDVYGQLIPGRSEIPAAQAEMARLFGIGDMKELAPAIIEGDIVEDEDGWGDLVDFAGGEH